MIEKEICTGVNLFYNLSPKWPPNFTTSTQPQDMPLFALK